MPEHLHYDDQDLVNPETHHEESDVNVRALIWFFVIFVAFAVVAHIGLWFLFKGFARIERRDIAPLTQMPRPENAGVPQNQPLLQPFPREAGQEVLPPNRSTPVTDLKEMREQEDQALHSYGWVDRQKGIVRMPIDQAKRLLLQRGLPVQASGAEP